MSLVFVPLARPSVALGGLVDTFAVALDEPIDLDVPGPGAGHIEVAGARDHYTFNLPAGERVFVDGTTWSSTLIRCLLRRPDGTTAIERWIYEPFGFTADQDGTWTLELFGQGGATGTYGLVPYLTDDDVFDIALGDPIEPGVPGVGAGSIEDPGNIDAYRVAVVAGQRLFFDASAWSTSFLRWQLAKPDGSVALERWIYETFPVVADQSGTWTLRVFGSGDAYGDYSATLYAADDLGPVPMALDEFIGPGVPVDGAGSIENPGNRDEYHYEIAAGHRVFFDATSWTNALLRWMLMRPDGTVAADRWIYETAAIEAGVSGTWTLRVYGSGDATGDYSATLWGTDDDIFPVVLDQAIGPDDPGPGAGAIEDPGNFDEYTVEIESSRRVFADLGNWSSSFLRWHLRRPDGTVAADRWIYEDLAVTTDQGGTWTLRVYGSAEATGTYTATLWGTDDDLFDILPDQDIEPGIPGPGAGVIEDPGNWDRFFIEVDEPVEICLNSLAWSTPFLRWSLRDPAGVVRFERWIYEVGGRWTVEPGGPWELRVNGHLDAFGTYAIQFIEARQGDVNGDCRVDITDLLILLGAWGPCGSGDCDADITGDGSVDVSDLLILLADWT